MGWAKRLQDVLLVSLIAVLIWLWAERRNVQTYRPSSPVPVRVALPSDDLVVIEQTPERFSMQFRGAQGELDQVRRAIASNGITLELDQTEPGEMNLVMSDHLPEASPIAGRSVNVAMVDPPTMRLQVDRLVEREVELSFNPPDVELAADSLAISPSRVTVTLPAAQLEALGGEDELELTVESAVPVQGMLAGEPQQVQGRVRLPAALRDDPHVTVEPQEVRLSFTIDKKDDEVTLSSVPVWVTVPPSEMDAYRVTLDEDARVLSDVRISGPSDLVERVRDGTLRVVATLWLSSDDLARAVDDSATGAVSFPLPPSLNVTSETNTVRYTVTRRGG